MAQGARGSSRRSVTYRLTFDMPRHDPRTAACTRIEARSRLRQAEAFVHVAQLTLAEDDDLATPGVAAALAVLGGIAAADAACCFQLGVRARGKGHSEARRLVARVSPDGPAIARDLGELLAAKDEVHYGTSLISRSKAENMVRRAVRMTGMARGCDRG